MIGSPFIGGGGVQAGTYPSKGSIDASLAANLPASPSIGDTYNILVAGDFEDSALLSPQSYPLTVGDSIVWDGTNWLVRESGDDSLKTSLNLSDVASAATARTNLSVPGTVTTGVTGADQVTNIISLTQAEYDAITPDASTIYVITDAPALITESKAKLYAYLFG